MGMDYGWRVSPKERSRLITALTGELGSLRAAANISQEELSEMIGVSRQTYGAVERGTKKLSWCTFLALVLFYDYNERTHHRLREIQPIHNMLYQRFNEEIDVKTVTTGIFADDKANHIVGSLDDQALHAIRTLIMIEYARCTSTPGDVVVKAFDGADFTAVRILDDVAIRKALQEIQAAKKGE